jgi:hypothetical protein
LFVFCFGGGRCWQYWRLNSGPHACAWATLSALSVFLVLNNLQDCPHFQMNWLWLQNCEARTVKRQIGRTDHCEGQRKADGWHWIGQSSWRGQNGPSVLLGCLWATALHMALLPLTSPVISSLSS